MSSNIQLYYIYNNYSKVPSTGNCPFVWSNHDFHKDKSVPGKIGTCNNVYIEYVSYVRVLADFSPAKVCGKYDLSWGLSDSVYTACIT